MIRDFMLAYPALFITLLSTGFTVAAMLIVIVVSNIIARFPNEDEE